MKRASAILYILIFAMALIWSSSASAQSFEETFNQLISDLQKNPNDYALREKIIRYVQTMEPKPAVPEYAKKYIDRGMAAAEDAKSEKDYKDAVEEFQKAVNIAPWLGAGYRGLAVTQDKAGLYSQALQNLKLFLLTNPSAEDAEKAKTLRNKIEYRMEKAAKESSPEALAAKKQEEFDKWLNKIEGSRYKYSFYDNDSRSTISWTISIENRALVERGPGGFEWARCEIRSREFNNCSMPNTRCKDIFKISEDGNTIVHDKACPDSSYSVTMTYYRQ